MDRSQIPVVILCGGQGTRIRDAADHRPKPMMDVGGKPILWHIMNIYASHGFRKFVLCLGYMGEQIRRFVLDYHAMTTDFTVQLAKPDGISFHNGDHLPDWQITCVDTGENTLTGGRVWRVRDYIDTDHFMLTYGDGVSNVDLGALVDFHLAHGRVASVTGVHPPGRFGDLNIDGDRVVDFSEKRQTTEGVINGGFFMFRREFLDRYLTADENLVLEREPLERLAADSELMVRIHQGFWQCMDTYRDWQMLNDLWKTREAPWKTW